MNAKKLPEIEVTEMDVEEMPLAVNDVMLCTSNGVPLNFNRGHRDNDFGGMMGFDSYDQD